MDELTLEKKFKYGTSIEEEEEEEEIPVYSSDSSATGVIFSPRGIFSLPVVSWVPWWHPETVSFTGRIRTPKESWTKGGK